MASTIDTLPKFDFATLPSLDIASLPAVFEDPSARCKSQSAALYNGRRREQRVASRRFIRMEQLQRAMVHIGSLPGPGVVIHGVMSGRYDAWQLVEAIVELGGTIRHLTVATLGFSRRHADELFACLDGGRVGGVTLVLSHYFRRSDPTVFDYVHSGLATRGQTIHVLRSHAKLLLAELADGRSIVVETSANLRSSQNVEQWTLADDAELLQFHRTWIADLIEATAKEATS